MADTSSAGSSVTFGPFRLDMTNRMLSRGGVDVALPPRAVSVLWLLVARAGHVVSKQDLLDTAWKDAYVSDTSLAEAISLVRHTLGDDAQQPAFIQTLPRRGYRFVAPVSVDGPTAADPPAREPDALPDTVHARWQAPSLSGRPGCHTSYVLRSGWRRACCSGTRGGCLRRRRVRSSSSDSDFPTV